MRKDYTSADALLTMLGATITQLARAGKLDATAVEIIFNNPLEMTSDSDLRLHQKLLDLEEFALKAAAIAEHEREEEREPNDDDTPER